MKINSQAIFSTVDSNFYKNKNSSNHLLLDPQQPSTSFSNNNEKVNNLTPKFYSESDSSDNEEFYCTPRSTNSLNVISDNFISTSSDTNLNWIKNKDFFCTQSFNTSLPNQHNHILTNTPIKFPPLRSCSSGSLNSITSANRLNTMLNNRNFSVQQHLLSVKEDSTSLPSPPSKRSIIGFPGFTTQRDGGYNDTKSLEYYTPNYKIHSKSDYYHPLFQVNNASKSRVAIDMINAVSPSIALAMALHTQTSASPLNANNLGSGVSATSSGNGAIPNMSSNTMNITSRLKVRGGFEPHHLEPLNK